jgi:hypothetical protein
MADPMSSATAGREVVEEVRNTMELEPGSPSPVADDPAVSQEEPSHHFNLLASPESQANTPVAGLEGRAEQTIFAPAMEADAWKVWSAPAENVFAAVVVIAVAENDVQVLVDVQKWRSGFGVQPDPLHTNTSRFATHEVGRFAKTSTLLTFQRDAPNCAASGTAMARMKNVRFIFNFE